MVTAGAGVTPGIITVRARDAAEPGKFADGRLALVKVELDIFNEWNGPQLDDAHELNPGSFVLINKSADSSFTKAVEIKAYDTGPNSKIAGVRRTAFKITYSPVNTGANFDTDNALRFPRGGELGALGKAEVVTPGGAVTAFAAKVEATGNISPTGINWTARAVTFVYTDEEEHPPAAAKWQFRMMRDRRTGDSYQNKDWGTEDQKKYRWWDTTDWANDGDSDSADAQYPTDAKRNKFFRIDAPGFYKSAQKQGAKRADYREFVQWHNGTGWGRSSLYAEWHCNLTGDYPGCTTVAPNTSGASSTAGVARNNRPVANAGPDQAVAKGANVTLAAASTDGDGVPSNDKDDDNDRLLNNAWQWTQTGGPEVALSNGGVGRTVTFTAPNVAQQTVLTFQVRVQDGTQSVTPAKFRPTNHTSNPDEVKITVEP